MNQESQNETDVATVSESFCTEEEFAEVLADRIGLLVHIDTLAKQNQKSRLSRKVHATIADQAGFVEDLLEDHDARYNKTFAPLLELVASLRAFGLVGLNLRIIRLHTRTDGFLGDVESDDQFRQETGRAQRFTDRCVRVLLAEIHKEASRVCKLSPINDAQLQILSQDGNRKRLPHTLGADDHEDVGAMIATEASLFLAANKTMNDRAPCQRFDDIDAMRQFVSRICTEEQARFLEAKLQNIKSRYDTYIANTPTEIDNELLRDFRHALSMSLHLTRVLGNLVHFYERHEDDLRSEATKTAVTELIDKKRVLGYTLNYGLYFVYRFMGAGVPCAEKLLSDFTTTMSVDLTLPEGVILHARPASLIAKIVAHHNMPVTITINGESCYAGSIMQVILLAGNHIDAKVVNFKGDHTPVRHLEMLFESGLGEEGLDTLPSELDYLQA